MIQVHARSVVGAWPVVFQVRRALLWGHWLVRDGWRDVSLVVYKEMLWGCDGYGNGTNQIQSTSIGNSLPSLLLMATGAGLNQGRRKWNCNGWGRTSKVMGHTLLLFLFLFFFLFFLFFLGVMLQYACYTKEKCRTDLREGVELLLVASKLRYK